MGNDTFAFRYANGRYTVTWRGQRYVDGDNGAVARADNVVIMRVRNVPDGNRDVLGSASVLSKTVGRGSVTVYRDGRKINGSWARSKTSGPLRFTDPAGQADRAPARPDLGHAAGLRSLHARVVTRLAGYARDAPGLAELSTDFSLASVAGRSGRATLVAHRSRRPDAHRCSRPGRPRASAGESRPPGRGWRAAETGPVAPDQPPLDLTAPLGADLAPPRGRAATSTVVRARWTSRPRRGPAGCLRMGGGAGPGGAPGVAGPATHRPAQPLAGRRGAERGERAAATPPEPNPAGPPHGRSWCGQSGCSIRPLTSRRCQPTWWWVQAIRRSPSGWRPG